MLRRALSRWFGARASTANVLTIAVLATLEELPHEDRHPSFKAECGECHARRRYHTSAAWGR